MKKIVVFAISAAVLILVIFGAYFLYGYLSERLSPEDLYISLDSTTIKDAAELKGEVPEKTEQNDNDADENENNNEESLAPDFTVYDKNGDEVTLYSMLDKPVVMNFWATWCGPCKSELPAFEQMYNTYKDDVNFMMINVTDGDSQTREIVDEFVKDGEYTFPVYYDETLMASYIYGASSIPLTVFVYPDGTLYGGRVGAMQRAELEYYIKDVLEVEQ